MQEQLIKPETEKLALKKGFEFKQRIITTSPHPKEFNGSQFDDHGITQALLQKWLREEHNIDVWSQPFLHKNSLPDESYSYFLFKDGVWIKDEVDFLDFEEALEGGFARSIKSYLIMKQGDVIKCVDDKNQPQGACVVEGQDYVVISSRMNEYGQRIVFLEGVPNNGRTSKGLEWNGYNAKRFGSPINPQIKKEELEYAMN